jgi:hypothetical protein
MTPEETYKWVGSALKVSEKVKADMLSQLPSMGFSEAEIAKLTDAIEHVIAVEILTKLGEKLRTQSMPAYRQGVEAGLAYDPGKVTEAD